jgi:hypothetical protein
MTRLELLYSYTLAQRRDAWISMGQQEVDTFTKTYTRNSLVRVMPAAIPLNGCIVFVDEDFVDNTFSWSDWTLDNASTGTIINTSLIIHPHLHVILTSAQYQSLTLIDFDPTFIPFSETALSDAITIDDDELNRILIEAGVPFIDLSELEYSKEAILKNMIYPAVQEYFKWFPIITMGLYGCADTNFDIPIPEGAFTAVRAYINPGYPISNVQGNPLIRYFDEVLMSISPRGAFSTPNLNSSRRQGFVDTQSYATYILERAARQGIINYGTRTRLRFFIQQGRVKGYTTKRGVLEIEWGSMSNKWSDIPFNRQSEARELAKAYVLRAFAMLRMQAKSDLPGIIDYSQFLTRADDLEKKVIDLWQASTKSVTIRM